jgi:tetratricopeptide (TPR) repeat protein
MQKTFLLALCALLFSCASPLKGKSPYWYNGYVYGTQAYDFFAQGKLRNAIASYEKGLAEARRYDIPQQASQYQFNIGRCWFELDEFDSALARFSTCNRDYLLLSDTLAACRSAGFAALCLCAEGNLDSAFVLYKQGSSWSMEKNDKALWLFIHGRLLWERDHGKEALNYFEEAFSEYKKQKSYNSMALMCYYRAGIYYFFGDYQEAKNLIDQALAFSGKSRELSDRWGILCAASKIYSCLKDPTRGDWLYERAFNCAPQGIVMLAREKIMECGKSLF